MRVNLSTISLLTYGSMFELVGGTVNRMSAHYLVVPFTTKSMGIYPGEYVARH